MSVGQASGVAMLTAVELGCEVVEYTSNEVKLAVTGFGGATKDQVQRMVARLLELDTLPQPADAADALALALCHLSTAPWARLSRPSPGSPAAQTARP
jgi:crossover junction endodeoxyribonuclease RuvC